MQRYQVHFKLVDENDKPVSGHRVTVQHFMVSTGRWHSGGTMATNAQGEATRTTNFASNGGAPMLRLVESGSPTRVLSHGGIVSFDKTSKLLTVDFGTIERLDDQAFQVSGTEAATRNIKETVAGAPNRPNISIAMMSRVVAANPQTMAVMRADTARVAQPTAAATIDPDQLKLLNTRILAFETREADLNRQILLKDSTIREKESQLSLSANQLNSLRELVQKREQEKAEIETRLTREKAIEIQRVEREKAAELAAAAAAKKAAEDRAAALGRQVEKQVQVDDLTANIGLQVQAAQAKMSAAQTPLRMGRVEINLKALVQNQGKSVTLPDAADIADASVGGRLADLKLEFLPEPSADPDAGKATVPDLSDLTETAARRVLQAAGLRMESAYGTPKGGNIASGQAFKQTPAKNTVIAKGQAVMVVFAR